MGSFIANAFYSKQPYNGQRLETLHRDKMGLSMDTTVQTKLKKKACFVFHDFALVLIVKVVPCYLLRFCKE